MLLIAVYLIAGLIALVVGAELLVRGASKLAAAAGISPLVVGLTVVAFGTSAPELAVSVNAALAGQADVALGNVIGSNTFNVLFILGSSALITPLIVSSQLIRLDVPVMIGVSFLVAVLAWDEKISRVDGGLLLLGSVIYTGILIRWGKSAAEPAKAGEPRSSVKAGALRSVGLGVGGLLLLILGSRWLVHGAVSIATGFGVSELVVGLTIIAAGTSLPEVVTSVIASLRGERDIAVGNVVGSNIFNLLVVLGTGALFGPTGIAVAPAVLRFDIPIMVAVAVACLPIFFTGRVIARWEGGLLLAYYVAYSVYLVLGATRHAAQASFGDAMMWFAIPLTLITLGITVYQTRKTAPPSG